MINLLKNILHNIAVVIVGLALAYLFSYLDRYFGTAFYSQFAVVAGWTIIAVGFLLRVWATYYFYRNDMRVIRLKAQSTLLAEGPYAYSRNPLYLGGNVFVFFGTSLVLGTGIGLILTALHLPLMDWMIRREERQLAASFGDEWTEYARRVRRWI